MKKQGAQDVQAKKVEPTYEVGKQVFKNLRTQLCPLCKEPIGDMPGMRDAHCHNCGYKDPCCE